MDLEAVEMLVRSAMHQDGATTLTELLRFPAPDKRAMPCSCGQEARYRELRSKTVLTAVGTVEVSRPYYLCPHCHEGQFPTDQELDIIHTELVGTPASCLLISFIIAPATSSVQRDQASTTLL